MRKKQKIFFWGLIGAASVFFILFWLEKPQIKSTKKLKETSVVVTKTPTATSTSTPSPRSVLPLAASPTLPPAGGPTTSTLSQTTSTTSTTTANAAPASNPQGNQINVSVTGSSSFTETVPDGSNQCDILTHAQQDGKISQLLMKYDASLGSYGVYQINNLGKNNQVWWTYKVNDQSPPLGCNHIKANNGDSVEWIYVGS